MLVNILDYPTMSETKSENEHQAAAPDAKSEIKELFEDLAGGIMESHQLYIAMVTENDLNKQKELKFECYALLMSVGEEIKDFLKAFRKNYGVKEAEVKKRIAEEEKKEQQK